MLTVKEVSQKLEIIPHAVRYYTDNGLVPSVKRDEHNNRLFDQESINWLLGIKHLRKCGMSIEAIKEYVILCLEGDCSIMERLEIIKEQKQIIDLKIKEFQKSSQYLSEKINLYHKTINHEIGDITNPNTWNK